VVDGSATSCGVVGAVVPVASSAVDTATAAAALASGAEPMIGMLASHASGPVAFSRRPMEIDRKARTTTGSKWVPAQRVSSVLANSGSKAGL
jgi:hypothetical protein